MPGDPGLDNDIKSHGITNPIRLVTDGESYELFDGYHRLNAAERNGITHLPVRIVDYYNRLTDGKLPEQELSNHLGYDWEDDDGHYDPEKAEGRGGTHTASTDGIRYAHIIEADVDDDLMRLAMPMRDAYDWMISDSKRIDDNIPERGTFYHGTDHEHQPGDILTSVRSRYEQEPEANQERMDYYTKSIGAPNHADWVWMYNHPAPATNHMKHVYEVEPLDEGPWIWNNMFDDDGVARPPENDQDFPRLVSPRVRVVRKLSPDEHAAANTHLRDHYRALNSKTAAASPPPPPPGFRTLHHFTTPQAARRIRARGFQPGVSDHHRNAVYFTTDPNSPTASGGALGPGVTERIDLHVPEECFNKGGYFVMPEEKGGGWLDDWFDSGEEHWAIPHTMINRKWIVPPDRIARLAGLHGDLPEKEPQTRSILARHQSRWPESHGMISVSEANRYRQHHAPSTDPHVLSLAHDIEQRGMQKPLEIHHDENGALLWDGNNRLSAAESLGMTHVPVTLVPSRSESGWSRVGPELSHVVKMHDLFRTGAVKPDRTTWHEGRLAMAWDHWAPQIKGGCDSGCDHDRYLMGEYSIDHTDGSGPQPSDLMPGIKGRSLLQFTHDTDQHGNPEIYVSGIHVDEGHRRDGIAEALMRRMHQDHPDTPINPGFTTDMGEGLLDGLKKRIPEAGAALVPRFSRLAMPAPLPQNLTFHHHTDVDTVPDETGYDEDNDEYWEYPRFFPPAVEARVNGEYVGHITWDVIGHPDVDGLVTDINVEEPHRRHGIATALFDEARRIEPKIHHSPERTELGKKWVDYEESRNARHAAVTQNLVDRLHGEFKDWHRQQPKGSIFGGGMIGGINEWPNIERFLKDRYPAAHRGLDMGYEEAGHVLLDGHSPMPYMVDSGMDTRPYETGPEAEATHGYDPKEIAAGMLLLHNKTDRLRGDMSQEDQARLNDIAQKRYQMQRAHEQRQQLGALIKTAAELAHEYARQLHDEFHDWARNDADWLHGSKTTDVPDYTKPMGGPLCYWENVEKFLKDRYPAVHRDYRFGEETARPVLDNKRVTFPPMHAGDHEPYETGPEAVARHGYDPKQVAAGMMYLHTWSHGGQPTGYEREQKLLSRDLNRLTDIFDKRQQMQRTYEQRQQPVTASIVRRDGEDDVVDCPSCLTESLADDYNHGGHCPVCGQFNWEYDEHRHGSLRTAMPTYYHHTDNPNFQPDSNYEPISMRNLNHPGGPGIFLTPEERPDMWRRGPDSYRAEFHSDEDVTQKPGVFSENYGLEGAPLEIFVPGEQMHHLDFQGVHPVPRTAAFDPDALHEQARTELGHLNSYLRDGIHSGLDMTTDSIEFHPHAHRIEMTPHWAGEAVGMNTASNFAKRTRARAGQYEHVLNRMVNKGPMDTQDGYLPPAHEHLESARNNFRVELQHGNHFTVPDLSAFSRLWNLTDADALGAVNPRYHYGTGGRTPEARDAYKINCQRCVLALDARHKGYNVEARANFRDLGNSHADEQLKDNHIADWWRDQNGMPGAWIDVEDLPDPSKRPDDGSDIANPKRRERYLRENADALHPKLSDNPGPHHWDHMADIMSSWGEGARGLIATTRQRPGGYMRHVIYARVGPGGKIAYDDPQDPTGFADHGAHWREHTAYGLSIYSKAERDEGTSLYDSPIAQIRHRNMKHSPLRFMRVDDKTLAPGAAKYLVDRGTAGPQPITPPRNI